MEVPIGKKCISSSPKILGLNEQISAILDEVFRAYGDFIDDENGLSYEGLLRTYDDGAGDVDRDFDALDLDFNNGIGKAPQASEASSCSIKMVSTGSDRWRMPAMFLKRSSSKLLRTSITALYQMHVENTFNILHCSSKRTTV
ncbi:PREDICTED: uncharacterized TPR repeat-containing protein At2g32450-like [Nelumbo nucifera]|uniref:Uncharacterized protein n=2 Tax=Nelumbo nucifera TaxID=4432 RepID=A0A822Z9D1_NELNU|nr:PREDICTED: uncharacterized TPR repeat-containing protein At2g32450-like [Nelumbo nucifera]DAD41457.1 TPA_asm: hypothetical protein HUJ06_015780 [Nelumbo nucifera]